VDIGDGILDIFDRYNFTVAEDEPLEKEVAIDPDLLGKAYEKFNAIRPDNFDEYLKALKSGKKGEENKFNKQYGVFYTPREIVHYMCQQSLINYLANELDGNLRKEAIEFLILGGEKFVEHLRATKEKKEINKDYVGRHKENEYFSELQTYASKIDFLLAPLKMCDPAVGSGAFPVGMMTEIVKARMFFVLTGCLKDEYINSHGEKTKRNPYNFKRDCIEHSLYGVDIDPGAVEIAKLRLWLSLVVDEDEITNIKPLPNLDYKIVCGNSLLGLSDITMMSEKLEKDLEKLKVDYFNETNPINKQNLRNEIDTVFKKLLQSAREFSKDIPDIDFDFRVHFSEVFHETRIEKDLKVFHITWVTHNSRRNENIAESKTEGTNPILLSLEDRNKIAKILSNRIIEKEYRVLALNVLDDHVHLLLVCEESDVSSIIGNLKGYSSYEFHRRTPSSNHTDSNHTVNRMVAVADDRAGIDDTTTVDGAVDSTSDRMVAWTDAESDTDTSRSAEPTPTYSDGTIRKLWAAKFSNTYMKSDEHFVSTIEYI
jgi:REP element-mobilizing transposase RayT